MREKERIIYERGDQDFVPYEGEGYISVPIPVLFCARDNLKPNEFKLWLELIRYIQRYRKDKTMEEISTLLKWKDRKMLRVAWRGLIAQGYAVLDETGQYYVIRGLRQEEYDEINYEI